MEGGEVFYMVVDGMVRTIGILKKTFNTFSINEYDT